MQKKMCKERKLRQRKFKKKKKKKESLPGLEILQNKFNGQKQTKENPKLEKLEG